MLGGCAWTGGQDSTPAAAPSAGSSDGGQVFARIVQWNPAQRLRVESPDEVSVDMRVDPRLQAELVEPPRYGSGSGAFPRSVSLKIKIRGSNGLSADDNVEFDTRSIRAWFQGRDGAVSQVMSAPCESHPLPHVIGPGHSAVGCLAYYLPAEEGRLQIRGHGSRDNPFKYFLRVPGQA